VGDWARWPAEQPRCQRQVALQFTRRPAAARPPRDGRGSKLRLPWCDKVIAHPAVQRGQTIPPHRRDIGRRVRRGLSSKLIFRSCRCERLRSGAVGPFAGPRSVYNLVPTSHS
jgi:hypothetical protein